MGSLLYAINVPDFGGDTLFSSMYEAFSSLSSGLQTVLWGSGLNISAAAWNQSNKYFGPIFAEKLSISWLIPRNQVYSYVPNPNNKTGVSYV